MYALSVSVEGDFYLCVPPDPSIEAATLGATESVLPCTAPAEALHTFTLDSCASHCFFRDSTTLTPLSTPLPVRLADPSGGPVLARSSTVLPCPAVPFGSLSGLHLPSFSTNLVSTAALQDAMITTTTPGGSSLYTLATEPPQEAASALVSTSRQVAPPCSCRLLSHQTLLWHHLLGHPSLPHLRGMHSRLLGRAPSGVSQVDPLPRTAPVEVAVGSGAASGGAAFGGAEPAGAESKGAGLGGVEPGGAEPRGTASSGGLAGASPRLSPWPEPLSPQQLREWFAQRTRFRSGAAGAGDSAARYTGARGAGVTAGAGGTRGTAAARPGGARTWDINVDERT
ncbi:unnamed protein product [Closterium sp. NIES-53]